MVDRVDMPRFYVPDLVAEAGAEAVLPPGESHHAAHVLRLRAGATVELFDGRGGRATGRLTEVGRREARAVVEVAGEPAARRGPVVHVAFAVPKGSRLDWLLEKATELGAASLRPVIFERSVTGTGELTDAKRDRWLGHCVAAAKQAGTDYLPELADPVPLAAMLAAPLAGVRIVGDLGKDARSLTDVLTGRAAGEVVVLVGPEGGFSEAERSQVLAAGFVPVRIGATTLRIETAAVALLAAVAVLGD